MKKQILVLLTGSFLSTHSFAQTPAAPLQTSTESESSVLSLRSYEAEGIATLGTFAPPNGRTDAGRYLTISAKVNHKATNVAISAAANFNQFVAVGSQETSTMWDNPTANVTKSWNDVGAFDSLQAGLSTTFTGNAGTAATTYRGSIAPSLKTVLKSGKVTWTQTLAYSRGFFRENIYANKDGDQVENHTQVLKTGQALGYSFSDALTVTAYGHGVYPITASGTGRGRVLGCLGAEYALNKMAVLGVGYGSGVNFLGLDPMSDQLAWGSYNDSGYVELNLTF